MGRSWSAAMFYLWKKFEQFNLKRVLCLKEQNMSKATAISGFKIAQDLDANVIFIAPY